MAFPAVSLYDTFNRANETPISNGGRWASITGLTSTTTVGTLVTRRYAPESFTAGKETAAYWTPIEFGVIPAVAFETKEAEANAERYDSLFICLSNPTVAEKCSGYRLKWITTGVAKNVEIKVDVIEANVVTQLALTKEVLSEAGDLYGLSIEAGTVKAWHKTGAGAWTEVNSTANTKYTQGFVGIGGAGSNEANRPSKFEIGGTKIQEAKAIAFVTNSGTSANAATAGGELEFTGVAGQVGNRWILALAKGSEAGAESITDSLGSTWKEDAYETNTALRCELWSAEIISNAIPTIKVKGLGALTKVALTIAEFSGIQASGNYVASTAGGKGTGTAVNAGTLAANERQLAFAGFAVLSEATLTAEGGFTTTESAKISAISAEGMWLLKPSGSVTAKGTLSLTGVWAGEYALYRPQAVQEKLTATLKPEGTLKTITGVVKKILTATLKPEAVLRQNFSLPRTLTASVHPTGILNRNIQKTFLASIKPTGVLGRNTRIQLMATLMPEAVIHRSFEFKRFIQATFKPTGALNRNMTVSLKASLTPSGHLGRTTSVVLKALLEAKGLLTEIVNKPNNTPVSKPQTTGRNPRYRIPPVRIKAR